MQQRFKHLTGSPSLAVARAPRSNWPFFNVAQASRFYAQQSPNKVALYFDNEPNQTHSELDRSADQLAASLSRLGLVKGDVVSFQLPNWHEAAIINLAAVRLGLIVNPIVIIYREREVSYMLANSESKAVFIAEQYGDFDYLSMMHGLRLKLPDLAHIVTVRGNASHDDSHLRYEDLLSSGKGCVPDEPDFDVNDVKMLLYTSGTTGNPKGVLHTHRSLYWAMQNSYDHWSISHDDVMLMPSPVSHITGFCNGLEFPYYSGGSAAIMERWNAKVALAYLRKVGATMSIGATPFLQELVKSAKENGDMASSLRLFACGGADVPAELIRSANEWFPSISCCRVYGSSEAPLVTQGFIGKDQQELAATTDGEVVNHEVAVRGDEGQELGLNVVGEIVVKGPSLMLGYLQAEAQRDAFTQDGFFQTGDLGYVTENGAIVITGRKKDLIIRGGENISAKEIEDVLFEHEAVREAAVVSMPHKRLGETGCAFVILETGAKLTFKAMQMHCEKQKLSKQKFPERLEIISELPRTASGKIKKDVLRKLVRERLNQSDKI